MDYRQGMLPPADHVVVVVVSEVAAANGSARDSSWGGNFLCDFFIPLGGMGQKRMEAR